ncbi:hypothetical protein [Hoeflea olei]|nr:hypothetical protein [Hoeflea olei]
MIANLLPVQPAAGVAAAQAAMPVLPSLPIARRRTAPGCLSEGWIA